MKNLFIELTNEELGEILKNIFVAKEEGIRAEGLVPYAKELQKNIGENEISLSVCLELSKNDFYEVLGHRFLELTK